MTILSLPTFSRTAPSAMTFSLVANTMRSESPLNRSTQTAELPGARWMASFSWQNLTDADARILKAWLNKLTGMAGRFYLCDHTHTLPAGCAFAPGAVYGANQTGRSIVTQWPLINNPSAWRMDTTLITCDSTLATCDSGDFGYANALLPGDYVGIGGELKIITETANVDSDGMATIVFEPPLRKSPLDGSKIVINRPTCVMMLTSDEQDKFPFQERNVTNVQIDCIEAF